MARAHDDDYRSLRFGRRESARLVAALLLSVLVHIVIWGGYHIGDKRGWWPKPVSRNAVRVAVTRTRSDEVIVQPDEAQPETFVDVSHADADAPVRTKFYSNKNSRAGNPEPGHSDVPKLAGTQTIVPKTEDEPDRTKKLADTPIPVPEIPAPQRPAPSPLDLKMPSPQLARIETPEPPQTPGETDLKMPEKSRPEAVPAQPKSSPAARPRTLRDALAQRDQLPGNKMQQEGGVRRHAEISSMDAKATSFAAYDRAWIDAVIQRWYDVTDRHPADRVGRVSIAFKLKSDGAVVEIRILENNMGQIQGYLCQESIEEASPFGPWPPDMLRMYAANYIDIVVTFNYN